MTTDNGSKFISKVISFVDLGLIILLGLAIFYPGLSEINAIKIITSINVILYNILSTIMMILLLVGVVVLFLFAYTDKVDSTKINWNLSEDKSKLKTALSKIWGFAKIISLFVFAAMTNHNYVATITALILLEKIAYEPMVPAVKTKMTILALAEENKSE